MAKTPGKVAKKYARALFESYPHTDLETIREALKNIAEAWSSSRELRDALMNPAYPLPARTSALQTVSSKIRSGDEKFQNFLAILLENRRLDALGEIHHAFSGMLDALKKLLSLQIVSAFPVSESEKGSIQEKVKKQVGDMAKVSWETDPTLLGGLVIRSGDRQLDNSIRGSLEKVRASIAG